MQVSRIILKAKPMAVILAATFIRARTIGEPVDCLLSMPVPAVIRPGSAYYAARVADRHQLLARLQYQLAQEVAAEQAERVAA